MIRQKTIKKILYSLLCLGIIGFVSGVALYTKAYIKKNKNYETIAMYSMTEDRYSYLTKILSGTQAMMFEEPMLANGYYKLAYSKAEFSYFAKVFDWIQADYIVKMKPTKVLDVGCAYGTLLFYIKQNLPSAETSCVDFTGSYFPNKLGAQKNINFSVTNIETEELPFKENFDLIILTEVLEHFNYNPISTLKKLSASLKKDGVLYLSTPDSSSGWGVATKYYQSFNQIPSADICTIHKKCTNVDDHVWQYNLKELLHVVNEAGFEVEKLEYTFSGPVSRHFNLLLKKLK